MDLYKRKICQSSLLKWLIKLAELIRIIPEERKKEKQNADKLTKNQSFFTYIGTRKFFS